MCIKGLPLSRWDCRETVLFLSWELICCLSILRTTIPSLGSTIITMMLLFGLKGEMHIQQVKRKPKILKIKILESSNVLFIVLDSYLSGKLHPNFKMQHIFRGGIMFLNVSLQYIQTLTHWDRVTHICVGNLVIIGSDNGLSPGRCQAIIWTNAGILLIGPLGTNFSEISIEILTFSFKKMRLKVSSAKWRHFVLGSVC